MIKSDEIERTSRPPATRTSWLALCSLSLILCSIIGIQLLVPFSSLKAHVYSSTSSDIQSLPISDLKENKRLPKENAEELLLDSLVLLQDLLIRISEGDSSSSLPRRKSNKLQARGISSDISNFFSGLGGGGGASGAGGDAGGGFSSLLGKLGFGNLTDSLSAGAADASKYLGIGLGNGTISALELPANYVKPNKVLAAEKPTGINLIAANLGQGLTSSLVGSINTDSIAPDPQQISLAAKAVGEGAGNGAAAGLNLKPLEAMPYSNDSGIPGIAGNLAQGLTSSFLSGVDVKSLVMSNMGTISPDQINAAAKSLAQGLGSGAAFATKLSTVPPSNASFDSNGISGIAGNLGQGLSTSFLQDIPFQQLLNSNAPSISPAQIADAAKGLGAGLAGGAVVGAGLQPDNNSGPNVQLQPGGIGMITESFGRGLSQSFLSNGTVTKLLSTFQQQQPSTMNIGSVAKGLAIGLVDGATMSFDNAGGINNIFNLDSSTLPGAQNATKPTNFDDTVGGAAVGFGNGLSLQTTTFILQLFGKPPLNQASGTTGMMTIGAPPTGQASNGAPATGQTSNGAPATGQTPNGAPSTGQASNGAPFTGQSSNAGAVSPIRRRQTTTPAPATAPTLLDTSNLPKINSTDLLNLPEFNGTISPIVQKAVDTLQCQGIGGLVTVLFSVGSSQGLSAGSTNVDDIKDKVNQFGFAKQPIKIRDKQSENVYDVNVAEFKIKINGNDIKKQIVVLVLHIFLAVVAFVILIPVIVMINSIRNFAIMSGRTEILKNSRKIQWALGLAIVLPLTLIVFATGIVGDGNKRHFISSHGILGLILTALTLTLFPFAFLASRNQGRVIFSVTLVLVLALVMIVPITGFLDLSALTLCATAVVPQTVFMVLGILLTALLMLATTLIALELLLKRWGGLSADGMRRSNMFLSGRSSMVIENGTSSKPAMGQMAGQDTKNFMEI